MNAMMEYIHIYKIIQIGDFYFAEKGWHIQDDDGNLYDFDE